MTLLTFCRYRAGWIPGCIPLFTRSVSYRIARSSCLILKLHSISPPQTFQLRSFPQHRNKSIWHLPSSLWDRPCLWAPPNSFLFRKSVFYETRCFLRRTCSFLLSIPPSISYLSRCGKVETYDKSIGQVRPEKKAFNGYISLPRASRFNDDTESAKLPNQPLHCPTPSNSFSLTESYRMRQNTENRSWASVTLYSGSCNDISRSSMARVIKAKFLKQGFPLYALNHSN